MQIRYSGVAISAGNELQGLTTGGVGRGTTIDHVQIHNSADDGIEIFGGTHNARYLVVTGADDDDFDTDFGYNGSIQFALGIKRTGNGSSDPSATSRSIPTTIARRRRANICGSPTSPSSRRSPFESYPHPGRRGRGGW